MNSIYLFLYYLLKYAAPMRLYYHICEKTFIFATSFWSIHAWASSKISVIAAFLAQTIVLYQGGTKVWKITINWSRCNSQTKNNNRLKKIQVAGMYSLSILYNFKNNSNIRSPMTFHNLLSKNYSWLSKNSDDL